MLHHGLVVAHRFFPDLVLVDDIELAHALGSEVVTREELQAWPLAVTEDIRLADGRRYVCKTQLPPTVEPHFYEAAASEIMPSHLLLENAAGTHTLLVEWLDHPQLDPRRMGSAEYLRTAHEVVRSIAGIEGDLPVHLDLATARALGEAVQQTSDRLRALSGSGRFVRITGEQRAALRAWGRSAETIAAATRQPTVVHADLSPAEVFLVPDRSVRIIDWQRPVRGPRDIDLVSLLRAAAIDPLDHVDHVVVELEAFVRLHWAALCATDVLPSLPAHSYEAWSLDALIQMGMAG